MTELIEAKNMKIKSNYESKFIKARQNVLNAKKKEGYKGPEGEKKLLRKLLRQQK